MDRHYNFILARNLAIVGWVLVLMMAVMIAIGG